jgi:spoIIIJ-associated protein
MSQENQDQPKNPEPEPRGSISQAENAKQICQKILSFFPLYSTPRVQAWEEQGKVVIEIYGDKSGILIGKHGQTLTALELVLGRIIQHQSGESLQIWLDCEGYRKRRQENLERLARERAEDVAKTGSPVNLGPMTSEERRIIHICLKDHPLVYTESRGEPPMKEILIKPRPALITEKEKGKEQE